MNIIASPTKNEHLGDNNYERLHPHIYIDGAWVKPLDKEWRNEHRPILFGLFEHFGLGKLHPRSKDLVDLGTLSVDGRDIPVEAIIKALHEQFMQHRKPVLVQGLMKKLVEQAGRKIWDEENKE